MTVNGSHNLFPFLPPYQTTSFYSFTTAAMVQVDQYTAVTACQAFHALASWTRYAAQLALPRDRRTHTSSLKTLNMPDVQAHSHHISGPSSLVRLGGKASCFSWYGRPFTVICRTDERRPWSWSGRRRHVTTRPRTAPGTRNQASPMARTPNGAGNREELDNTAFK